MLLGAGLDVLPAADGTHGTIDLVPCGKHGMRAPGSMLRKRAEVASGGSAGGAPDGDGEVATDRFEAGKRAVDVLKRIESAETDASPAAAVNGAHGFVGARGTVNARADEQAVAAFHFHREFVR